MDFIIKYVLQFIDIVQNYLSYYFRLKGKINKD